MARILKRSIDFELFDITDDKLPDVISILVRQRYRGCSVTIPYKQAVLPFMQQCDPLASELQAVNSIAINETVCTGYNTDVAGVKSLIESENLSPNSRALVLGGGGAARSAVKALLEKNFAVTICCRSSQQLLELKSIFPDVKYAVDYQEWGQFMNLKDFQVVLNTTPLGGANHPDAACPLDFVTGRGSYLDLNYNSENRWIKLAQSKGWNVRDGSLMLVTQAVASFLLWTGIEAEVAPIHAELFPS